MIKNVFNAIKKRLEEIPELKATYWYHRQRVTNKEEGDSLFEMPSAHIEFVEIKAKQLTKGIEFFDVTIKIHLPFEALDENEDDNSLANLDLIDLVSAKMNKWSAKKSYITSLVTDDQFTIINNMVRKNILTDHEPTNLVVPILEYNFIAYDLANFELGTLTNPAIIPVITNT